MKKHVSLLSAFFLTLLSPQFASACSVCFGNPQSLQTMGLKMGMLALLLCIFFVLGGIVAFIIQFNLRAKNLKHEGAV